MRKEKLTQAIGKVPLAGSALRWYANQYNEGSVVRIKQGLGANLLWKRHHRYVNGYWIGHYELPIQDALKRLIKPGDTFFDVGANAGFFTLIASRLIGTAGRCIAFDPSPENTRSIAEQIELNSLTNCTVVGEAIADCEGTAEFYFESPGSPVGHLGQSGNGEQRMEVTTTTLDHAALRFGAPNFIKMDIEGAEGLALQGAAGMLNEIRPIWLIELHSDECERAVREQMSAAEYEFFDLQGERVAANKPLPGHVIARASD